MDKYLRTRDGRLVVGLQKTDDLLISYLKSKNIPIVDVSNDMVFSFSGNHWTPEGHQYVASKIKAFITELEEIEL